MGRDRVADRRHRAHVGDDRGQVIVGQIRERHERQHHAPVGVNAMAKDARDLGIAGAADPRLGIGRDVRDAEDADRQMELEAARQRDVLPRLQGRALLGRAVAIGAVGRAADQVTTTLESWPDRGWRGCRDTARPACGSRGRRSATVTDAIRHGHRPGDGERGLLQDSLGAWASSCSSSAPPSGTARPFVTRGEARFSPSRNPAGSATFFGR